MIVHFISMLLIFVAPLCAMDDAGQGNNRDDRSEYERKEDKDSNGNTALHRASMKGQTDVVRQLLKGKADIHAVTDRGWSALSFAILRNHASVVEVLLAGKIDPNVSVGTECTSYHPCGLPLMVQKILVLKIGQILLLMWLKYC